MSTTAVSAGQIMDRVANLLNDPNKTDYKYNVMVPYLNMAIEEFSDMMAEANAPVSNFTSTNYTPYQIIMPVGVDAIVRQEDTTPGYPKYPDNLVEIQEIGERPEGSNKAFHPLPHREFNQRFPTTNSLLFWTWDLLVIRFNPGGANLRLEIELKYVIQGVNYVVNENDLIHAINSRTYLAYKTAALCAFFIGENETRAAVLEAQAEKAIDRAIAISNKGRQSIMTRHRPFRAAFKARGGY